MDVVLQDFCVGVWQPRAMGEKQHLPAHLPGLSPNHPWLCCLRTNCCAGAQPDDDGGVREADGELQGRARRAAAEADKADVLR